MHWGILPVVPAHHATLNPKLLNKFKLFQKWNKGKYRKQDAGKVMMCESDVKWCSYEIKLTISPRDLLHCWSSAAAEGVPLWDFPNFFKLQFLFFSSVRVSFKTPVLHSTCRLMILEKAPVHHSCHSSTSSRNKQFLHSGQQQTTEWTLYNSNFPPFPPKNTSVSTETSSLTHTHHSLVDLLPHSAQKPITCTSAWEIITTAIT